jgi:hydroxymethylglutaryl-CoA lyase
LYRSLKLKSVAEITIVDTSPRDGPVGLPKIRTAEKIALANSLMESGVTKIDCVGFTHPRIRPEYADAEKVVSSIDKRPGVTIIGMTPNEIACRRALATNIDEVGVLVAASESSNRALLSISIKKVLFKTIPAIIQACKERGKTVRAFLTAAFWCQFEGRTEINDLVELVSKLSFLGVNEISLVDTPGMANPNQVIETVRALQELRLETSLAVHFHNTTGLGLVNSLAAYEAGIRTFDAAICGLSGTPYGAPAMEVGSWNVPTEDLVYMFEQLGVNTGIDIDAIAETAQLAQKIAGRELSGHLVKAREVFLPSGFSNPLFSK